MRLKKVTLNNFRCFQNLEVELHPRLTVLVGENGAGKTAVLDGIAAALSRVLRHLSSANQRLSAAGAGIKDTDFRIESWEGGVGRERWGVSDYVQVIAETTEGLQWDYWRRSSVAAKEPPRKIGETALASYFIQISNSLKTANPELLPVFAYYGIHRGFIEVPERLHLSKENYSHPTSALIDALNSSSNFEEMLKWFYLEENSELRENRGQTPENYHPSKALIAVRNTIEILLGGAYINPHFNQDRKFLLEASDAGQPLQVSQLSQGFQSMLALGMDFSRRLALANQEYFFYIWLLQNELSELYKSEMKKYGFSWQSRQEKLRIAESILAPAIMLVDEIDLHLHPSWQQRVLDDLMRAFPGTQFIVTTHSPQVLTTVSKENIRIIRETKNGHVAAMPTMSPLARKSGDALAYIQDTPVRPHLDILNDIHEYEQLVRDGLMDSDKGRAVKSVLDEAGYEIPEADLALWQFLGRQAGKIKP